MTEPVSHLAEARTFLFFKDARPVGPSIDAMITAAIQEIKDAIGLGLLGVILLSLVFKKVSYFLGPHIQEFTDLFRMFVFWIAMFGIIASLSKFKPRLYQSGIPNKRTRFGNALRVCVIIAASWAFLVTFGSLIFGEQLKPFRSQSILAIVVTSSTMFLYAMRFIQDRVEWILDLRAEQGLDFAPAAKGSGSNAGPQPASYGLPKA
jgi:hypothetical protein